MKKLFNSLFSFLLFISVANGQNLVVDYHFDDPLSDSSGNSNHLNQYGNGNDVSFVQGITSASGDSAAFFQKQKGLESTSAIDNSNWTRMSISCWIKSCVDGTIFQGAYFGQGMFATSNGSLGVYFSGNSANSLFNTSSTNLNDGNWHHIVTQNNGTTTQLYVDGTINGSQAENLYTLPSARSDAKIYFGIGIFLTGLLDGHVDNFKIFDDTLSQSQIDDLYNAKTASINEKRFVQKSTIYPNPANSTITISDMPNEALEYTISDVTGKVIEENHFTSNTIDISNLASGMYTISILEAKKVAIARGKLIKN